VVAIALSGFANSETKNQPSRPHIDECDERKTASKRVGSKIEKPIV
jgi:hypothetical protein